MQGARIIEKQLEIGGQLWPPAKLSATSLASTRACSNDSARPASHAAATVASSNAACTAARVGLYAFGSKTGNLAPVVSYSASAAPKSRAARSGAPPTVARYANPSRHSAT